MTKKTKEVQEFLEDKLTAMQIDHQVNIRTFKSNKMVEAMACYRGEYNAFQGWTTPVDENPCDEGMLVIYNRGTEDMHISWCPLDIFNEGNKEVSMLLSFGSAIEHMKDGCKIAREGWNGADMFVYLVKGSVFTVNREPLLGFYPEGTVINYREHMDLRTADGSIATWSPSGSDALAEDWFIVGEE